MDKAAFVEVFLRDYGFDPTLEKQVIISCELSPEYPLFFINIPGFMGIALYEALWEARDALMQLPAKAGIEDALRLLFEEGLEWQVESVEVFVTDGLGAEERPLPAGYVLRTVENMRELEDLAAAMTLKERMESLPWDTDDHVTGVYYEGKLVGVCGATPFDGYSDIAICVHPAHRGKGLSGAMLSYLDRQYDGDMLSYRVRTENIPAVHAAESFGFMHVFTYYGAQVTTP